MGKILADDRLGIPHREAISFEGLWQDEIEEAYCGDDCEGINRQAYRVAKRYNTHELLMSDYSSNSMIRLDFKGKAYERIERDFTGNLRIEKGSCEFDLLD